MYVEGNEDVEARWKYRLDDEEKFIESDLDIWFHTTTQISVKILIVTGVFLIQGPHFRTFIETEFPKIAEHVTNVQLQGETIQPPQDDNRDELLWNEINHNKDSCQTDGGICTETPRNK